MDSYPHKHELEEGLESIKRVVGHLNELQRKSENERIFSELVESMEDWLGLRPSDFGELLLSDQVLLVSNDQERSYELFLFEKLLLCCKKNKKDVRGKLQQSGTFGYILRGNIYVRSMLSVVNTSDPIFGDYSLKVYWKEASEPDLVCFRCKYRNEGQAALWADRLQTQIYKYRDRTETQPIEPVIQEPDGILTYMTNEVFEYIPEDNLVKQSEATTFNHPEHLHETKPLRRPIPPRGSSRSRNNNILRPGSNFDADNDRSSINTLESVEIAMRIGAVGLREATRQYSHSYPFDAMISLASSDRTLGQELYDLLSSNGFKVWVYWVNMSGNMDRSMMEGITRSALFIPILSDDYYGRMDCMFELQAASSQCKRSLVLKKPGVLPANVLAHLGRLQYIETKSLYQRCMDLIATLYSFPLFEFYLFPNGVNAHLANSNDTFYIADPVEVLWNCFKLGVPLCVIYNKLAAITSGVYIEPSDVSNVRPPFFPTSPCKDSYDKFINACNKDMNIQSVEVFDKSELYKDDTAGFMKVLKLVEEIIILIERNNGLPAPKPLPFSTDVRKEMATSPHLMKITCLLKELVETENAYIYALEELQKYEAELAASKVFSKDMIKSLFSNLNELVDFQRRFAIGLESTIRLGFDNQKIGELFTVNVMSFLRLVIDSFNKTVGESF
ncbi:hypothetical protein HDU79_005808 [Rhizoclosmatium sp. JEL0117]|nr:hypothetical protein HDU79_005808 [Rhizoclosmatium sp. JEL0117]